MQKLAISVAIILGSCVNYSRIPFLNDGQTIKSENGYYFQYQVIDAGHGILLAGCEINTNSNSEILADTNTIYKQGDIVEFPLIDKIEPNKTYSFIPVIWSQDGPFYGLEFKKVFAKTDLYDILDVTYSIARADSIDFGIHMMGSQHTATNDRGIVLYYPNESPNNPRIKVSVGETYQPTYQLGLGQLFPQVEYVCQPYMELENGDFIYGDTTHFIIRKPTIETGTIISQPTLQEAALSGKVTFIPGYITVTEIGHCWSTVNANPTLNDATLVLGSTSGVQDFNTVLRNIQPGIPYYYRAYLIYNSNKVVYGDSKSFVQ